MIINHQLQITFRALLKQRADVNRVENCAKCCAFKLWLSKSGQCAQQLLSREAAGAFWLGSGELEATVWSLDSLGSLGSGLKEIPDCFILFLQKDSSPLLCKLVMFIPKHASLVGVCYD